MNNKIDGKKYSAEIIKRIVKQVRNNKGNLKISVILVGNDKASLSYISQKKKIAEMANVNFAVFKFSEKIKKEELIKKVKDISGNCSGLIIQLPIPFKRGVQEILDSIPEKKDIDLLSSRRLGKFYTGDFYLLPPVTQAVSFILKKNKIEIKGKKITIIGSGKLVGKPLLIWLSSQGATVSIVNEFTKNLSFFTKNSDIIISGVGKKDIIKGDIVKKDLIAIDVGSSFYKGKQVGDFHESVYKKASLYTPVPGGIGPITSACLIENLLKIEKL